MAYFGVIFFANMGGGGGQNYFQNGRFDNFGPFWVQHTFWQYRGLSLTLDVSVRAIQITTC